MIENKVVVGISQGDINGIGLEIILKTLIEPELSEICIPVLFSSQKTVSYFRKALNLDEFNFNPLRDFNQIHTKKTKGISPLDKRLNCINKILEKYPELFFEKLIQ